MDPTVPLSEETGEETQAALQKYMKCFDLESEEEAIRTLLPAWAFNPAAPLSLCELQEITKKSRHYDVDVSTVTESEYTSDILDRIE